MDRKRFKILVEAYECSPVREHAAGASWQIVSRLCQWFDVWVLTEETQYAQEVTDYLDQHPELAETLHFHFIPRQKKGGFGRKRPPVPIRESLDYVRWQKDAFRVAAQLHELVQFDVAHHLRSNSFRCPGQLWKLDVPFVWGPMGGSNLVRSGLMSGLDLLSKIQYRIRNLINYIQYRCDWRVRNAVQNASCIFSQTSADQKNLQRVYGRESILLHEQAGSDLEGFEHCYDGGRVLNIAWVGRCIAGKALHLLLEAVAKMDQKERVRLHIVGDGPAMKRWKKQARSLGIADYCVWYGWVEAKRANEIIADCDLLAFTSILEGTPATVMNAMSLGVPVMTLKHFGMGDVVDDKCGFPIRVNEAKRVQESMSDILETILEKPELVEVKSRNALRSAGMFSWDHVAETIRREYWHSLGIFHVTQTSDISVCQQVESREVVCS